MPLSPMEVLRKVPLFSGLGESDLAAFADLTRERSYPKGSVIVFEDDPGDALFLVAAGQVKVVLIAEDGREVILSVLGEGSFFGEMAVIDEEPRSAHVIAMDDSSLLVLRREDFHARLRNSPEVAISLLKEISRRLRRADEKIGSLVLLDVNGRVAHLLLRMAEDEGGDRITRKLTHHTIAQMIGSSRETVSRTMRNLVERGIIQVTRKDITLQGPPFADAGGPAVVIGVTLPRVTADRCRPRRQRRGCGMALPRRRSLHVTHAVTFWGTRGSIPTPGPDTARYGGNTACISIAGPDRRLVILDAGQRPAPAGSRADEAAQRLAHCRHPALPHPLGPHPGTSLLQAAQLPAETSVSHLRCGAGRRAAEGDSRPADGPDGVPGSRSTRWLPRSRWWRSRRANSRSTISRSARSGCGIPAPRWAIG